MSAQPPPVRRFQLTLAAALADASHEQAVQLRVEVLKAVGRVMGNGWAPKGEWRRQITALNEEGL